jgi:hypothetical protein
MSAYDKEAAAYELEEPTSPTQDKVKKRGFNPVKAVVGGISQGSQAVVGGIGQGASAVRGGISQGKAKGPSIGQT